MRLWECLIVFVFVWCCVVHKGFLSLDIKYNVYTVVNEFIVTYHKHGLFKDRVLRLENTLDSFYLNYTIQPRWSSSPHSYSSDFDVVLVHNLTSEYNEAFIASLQRQTGIKRVSQQKRIQRTLLFYDDEGGDDFSGAQNISERKLSLFGKLWASPVPGTIPLHPSKQPWSLLKAHDLWARGLCGAGVRLGIFDTGLVSTETHPHFQSARILERTDWTNTRSVRDSAAEFIRPSTARHPPFEAVDGHGHGTFVAGIIAATSRSPSMISDALLSSGAPSKRPPCPIPGIAPQADLYIFRVFNDNQVSYTSWFLDAFNYAISRRLHVINLSVGGPDFLDLPFVDKVWELSSHGILLVSAIGNDGPLFGTLNNPADQMDVLGVGGVDATGRLARFSSRGMTTWALPFGYGQVKPDVVTFSTGVISSGLDGKCRTLSGTSVASPVVTGMVALLISAALERNKQLTTSQTGEIGFIPINPASIKQALVAGATPLAQVHVFGTEPIQWPASADTSGLFEQGAGLVDLLNSFQVMRRLQPQASLIPSYLDFTQCPFMWPFCSQPFYHSMQPVVVNVTILNSMAVIGHIIDPPIFHPLVNRNGKRLRVGFTYSQRLWPWTGYLAVHLQVESELDDPVSSVRFSGIAEGYVTLTVVSSDKLGVPLQTHLTLPIRVQIIPTPNRSRRVLYDQFHSIRYPSGYIPQDDLTRKSEPLDWLGDHIHTNMRDLYMHMRRANYYVEILTSPFTCFDASNYGTLLLVDTEEEFFPAEIEKLFVDVTALGLSLLVFAEWYNTSVIEALRFFDTNTRRIWTPETGGSNLPALNNLLRPFDIEFGDTVYAGDVHIGRRVVRYTSGSSLRRFPDNNISSISGRGSVLRANLVNLGDQLIRTTVDSGHPSSAIAGSGPKKDNDWRLVASDTDPVVPVLGLWTPLKSPSPCGRLAVFGDTDCLSSTHLNQNCFWLVDALLQFAISPYGRVPRPLAEQIVSASDSNSLDLITKSPVRTATSALHRLSNVIRSDRSFAQLSNGNLPAEAYRTLPLCPTVVRASYSPEENVYPNDSWYRPQPLLLHSPIRDSPTLSPNTCHSPMLPSPRMISDTRSLDTVSSLLDSFVVVYVGVMVFLLLLFRYVFPRTGVMFVRSIAHLVLTRPFAYWRHFIREREI